MNLCMSKVRISYRKEGGVVCFGVAVFSCAHIGVTEWYSIGSVSDIGTAGCRVRVLKYADLLAKGLQVLFQKA